MYRHHRQGHALTPLTVTRDQNEAELLLRYPGTALTIPASDRLVRRAVMRDSFSQHLDVAGRRRGLHRSLRLRATDLGPGDEHAGAVECSPT